MCRVQGCTEIEIWVEMRIERLAARREAVAGTREGGELPAVGTLSGGVAGGGGGGAGRVTGRHERLP